MTMIQIRNNQWSLCIAPSRASSKFQLKAQKCDTPPLTQTFLK